jgi:uncharacterized protein YgbK (DUF1537 family)
MLLTKNHSPDALVKPILDEVNLLCARLKIKIVVLDDDPTGTQTVHDIPVVTAWNRDLLADALQTSPKGFFILTNTRSLSEKQAIAINTEIAGTIKTLAGETGSEILLLSRGDSTLRGHFPAELNALEKGWGAHSDGYLLMPYFKEGGRYTINNIHYILEGNQLIPAAETPFARDPVFAYSSSNLIDYIHEKNSGMALPEIISITAEQLNSGPAAVQQQLDAMQRGQYAVVNASCPYHAAVFALAMIRQKEKGKNYLVRCAASLVQALFGIVETKLLDTAYGIWDARYGGLIVVGSFVEKTTQQLEHLLMNTAITPLKIDVPLLLEPGNTGYISQIAGQLNHFLQNRETVVLFTSRDLIAADNAAANVEIGRKISEALVAIVKQIQYRPGFFVAKGGITSSDIGTKALGIQKAIVAGQLLPGMPVWKPGPGSMFPDMPYIIFPGNVGTTDYLTRVYHKLTYANA